MSNIKLPKTKNSILVNDHKGWKIYVDGQAKMGWAFPNDVTVIAHRFEKKEKMEEAMAELKKTIDEYYSKDNA